MSATAELTQLPAIAALSKDDAEAVLLALGEPIEWTAESVSGTPALSGWVGGELRYAVCAYKDRLPGTNQIVTAASAACKTSSGTLWVGTDARLYSPRMIRKGVYADMIAAKAACLQHYLTTLPQ